jgi:hypothetical protein
VQHSSKSKTEFVADLSSLTSSSATPQTELLPSYAFSLSHPPKSSATASWQPRQMAPDQHLASAVLEEGDSQPSNDQNHI